MDKCCFEMRVRNMDTYVNGTIVNRHVFNSVPENYGDVWVTQRWI